MTILCSVGVRRLGTEAIFPGGTCLQSAAGIASCIIMITNREIIITVSLMVNTTVAHDSAEACTEASQPQACCGGNMQLMTTLRPMLLTSNDHVFGIVFCLPSLCVRQSQR